MMVAKIKEFAIRHCVDVLEAKVFSVTELEGRLWSDILADIINIAFALPEEDSHAFGHVYPQKAVRVSNDSCNDGQ